MDVLGLVPRGETQRRAVAPAGVSHATAEGYIATSRRGGAAGLKLEPRLAAAGTRSVWFVDAARRVHGTSHCCVRAMARTLVRGTPGRRRFNVLGAWDAVAGTPVTVTVTNEAGVSAGTTIERLGRVARVGTRPRTVVRDAARHQACAAVTAEAGRLRIVLLYLPPHSPT